MESYVWAGASIFIGEWPLALTAWADDPQTPEVDGYMVGNEMTFMVAHPDLCDSVDVCPNDSGYIMGDGTFGDGFAAQVGLTDETCCRWFTLGLTDGWNFKSMNTSPDEVTLPGFLSGVWDEINIIMRDDGLFCIPGVICNIVDWNVVEGYKIHMKSPQTVEFCGTPVDPMTTMALEAGWSWVSYLPDVCLSPDMATASISDCLNIVKDGVGGFYIPGVINAMDDMCPGEGYSIHLDCPDTLIYPEAGSGPLAKQSKQQHLSSMNTSHFAIPQSTSDFHAVVVIAEDVLEDGDEVAVFNSSGMILGSSRVQGNITPISVWSDDEQTEMLDGYKSGDEMMLRIWRQSENCEITPEFEIMDGSKLLGNSPYTVIRLGLEAIIPAEFELSVNYPNPFNPTTTIEFSLPKADDIEMNIYNVLGQKVKNLYAGPIEAGNHSLIWDGKDENGNPVSSGIYIYNLTSKQGTDAKKMVLIK